MLGTTTGSQWHRNDAGTFTAAKVLGATAATALAVVNVDTDTDLDVVTTSALLRQVPLQSTVVGISSGSVSFGDPDDTTKSLTINQVTGAFVMTAAGAAGSFSGKLQVDAGPASADASAAVRFNGTTGPVDEAVEVGGTVIPIVFTATEKASAANKPFIAVSGKGTLRLGDFIEISGGLTGTTASGLVFIGQGPRELKPDVPNPDAKGILITVTRGTVSGNSTHDMDVFGTVAVIGIDGVSFSGEMHLVVLGNAITITAAAVTLAFNGMELTGAFGLAKGPGTGPAATTTIKLGEAVRNDPADKVVLNLGERSGTTFPVVVTIKSGEITLGSSGLIASMSASVDLNLPGLDLTLPDGLVLLNTTSIAGSAGGNQIPAGTLRVSVGSSSAPAALTIAGQQVRGIFGFEQQTLPVGANAPPGTLPTKVIRVGATAVSISVGTPDTGSGALPGAITSGIRIDGGTAAFMVTPQGLAGRVSGTVTLVGLPTDFLLTGTFGVAINSGTRAVVDRVQVGDQTISLNLPAGPYVRFEATGVKIAFNGQSLTGDVAFEKATSNGIAVTRVAFRNVTAAFGDGTTPIVSLTAGQGMFLLGNAGLAGTIAGTVSLKIPGASLSGTFSLAINTATGGGRVTSTLTVGIAPATTSALTLADVNGDGRADLLVGAENGVVIFLADGEGDPFDTLPAYVIAGTAGTGSMAITALAVGDVDNNGTADLVIGRAKTDTEIWLGDGSGATFTKRAKQHPAGQCTRDRAGRGSTATATSTPSSWSGTWPRSC